MSNKKLYATGVAAAIAVAANTAAAGDPPWWNVEPSGAYRAPTVTIEQGDSVTVSFTATSVDCAVASDTLKPPTEAAGGTFYCDNLSYPHTGGLSQVGYSFKPTTSVNDITFYYGASKKTINVVVNRPLYAGSNPDNGVTREEFTPVKDEVDDHEERLDVLEKRLLGEYILAAGFFTPSFTRDDTYSGGVEFEADPWSYRAKPKDVFNFSGAFGVRYLHGGTNLLATTRGEPVAVDQARMYTNALFFTAALIFDLRWAEPYVKAGVGPYWTHTNDEIIVNRTDPNGLNVQDKLDEGSKASAAGLFEGGVRIFPGTRVFHLDLAINATVGDELAASGLGRDSEARWVGSGQFGAGFMF